MLLETLIAYFFEKNNISEIQKPAFDLPRVRILKTRHCGKEQLEVFKCQGNLYAFSCHIDYAEQVVSSFAHQIQS